MHMWFYLLIPLLLFTHARTRPISLNHLCLLILVTFFYSWFLYLSFID